MSKLKRNILTVIALIIAFFVLIPNTSKAIEYDSFADILRAGSDAVGNTIKANQNAMNNISRLFCIDHGTAMETATYQIKKYVTITGNTAKVYGGKTSTSTTNGKMAYILSKFQGYSGTFPNYSGSQLCVYQIVNSWLSTVGLSSWANGNNNGMLNPNMPNYKEGIKIMEAAEDYAASIGKADTSDIKIDDAYNYSPSNKPNVTISGSTVLVGPFRFSYTGTLSALKVQDQNSNTISSAAFVKIENGKQITTGVSGIKSNTNFYIRFNASAGVTAIKLRPTITISSGKIYEAEVWLLNSGSTQNLMYYDVSSKPDTGSKSFAFTFNITTGLGIEKVDETDSNIKLQGVKFKLKNTATGKYVKRTPENPTDSNYTITYVNSSQATQFTTDKNGRIYIGRLAPGPYQFEEISNPNYGYEENGGKIVSQTIYPTTVFNSSTGYIKVTNKRYTGDLIIKKVDAYNNQTVLPGVQFIAYAHTKKQYIATLSGKNITYTSDSSKAMKFTTDQNGILEINDIPIDTYTLIEVSNPNNMYEAGAEYEVPVDDKEHILENTPVYIHLSGYVWEDIQSTKMSLRNDLYRDNDSDDKDVRVQGVKVYLKDGSGNTIRETTTNGNGEYRFERVKIADLPNYHIEFEYNGLIYENVGVNLNKDNGSKASEGSNRDSFNNKFARVDPKTESSVQAKDSSGNNTYEVKYSLNRSEATASVIENISDYPIIASTSNAGFSLQPDEEDLKRLEVMNINLGIYRRPQVDLALTHDLDNVKVSIKGRSHVYKYESRFSGGQPEEDAWNVGVNFINKYGDQIYLRPIYRADAEYNDPTNPDNNLKVYLTYKIALRNESSVDARVNSITDYYDSRYTLSAVGSTVDGNGQISDGGKYSTQGGSSVGKYSSVDITLNETLSPQQIKYVYVQFELSRQNVLNLLNKADSDENLENLAEITSYTSYKDSKYYASVDIDSVIDNVEVGNKAEYEDDTKSAPSVGLTIANARQAGGVVFEDEIIDSLLASDNIREGDGKYDSSREKLISGVTVQLMVVDDTGNVTDEVAQVFDELSGTWKDAKCETETTDGTYSITGFLPGKYVLRYTWGEGISVDGTEYVDVLENYKATVIDQSRYNQEMSNPYYYQTAKGQHLSHAIDDYSVRQQVDTQLNSHNGGTNNGYNHKTEVTIDKITSETPIMQFNIEFNDSDLDSLTYQDVTGDVRFELDGIDFGIIRRAVQSISYEKRVGHISIKYPDGRTIIDADINADGTLSGQTNYLTYMKPTATAGGFVKAELDAEIMQNAHVEIRYDFTVTNTGEADYASEGFYNFGNGYYTSMGSAGETQKANDLITISPSKIVDYLDKDVTFKVNDETNTRYGWQQATIDDLRSAEIVLGSVTDSEEVINSAIYVTEYLKDSKIRPKTTSATTAGTGTVEMVVEKQLSSGQDANFSNDTEVVLCDKPGGSKITTIPGNYDPSDSTTYETDDSTAEEVIITPSTGANRNYIIIGSIGLLALVILGVGIYFIKKKAS